MSSTTLYQFVDVVIVHERLHLRLERLHLRLPNHGTKALVTLHVPRWLRMNIRR